MVFLRNISVDTVHKGDTEDDDDDDDDDDNNNTLPKYQKTTKLSSYRKQPYWALHTYFGKC
jgi:hypothetical protein